jgi:hypothetical protein
VLKRSADGSIRCVHKGHHSCLPTLRPDGSGTTLTLITNKCPFVNLPEIGRARWGDLQPRLLQLRILGLGSDENGNVRVGVFPQREEILVGSEGASAGGISIRSM